LRKVAVIYLWFVAIINIKTWKQNFQHTKQESCVLPWFPCSVFYYLFISDWSTRKASLCDKPDSLCTMAVLQFRKFYCETLYELSIPTQCNSSNPIFAKISRSLHAYIILNKQTPWSESASELYRQSELTLYLYIKTVNEAFVCNILQLVSTMSVIFYRVLTWSL
jgi:hypothetical protein